MVGMSELTYTPVGATRSGDLPPGFRHLRYRTRIGHGDEVFRRAGEAIMTFRMHRALGVPVTASADRAAPGVRVTIGAGPVKAPCEVVWSTDSPDEADQNETGWAYGTLPGHPASGEESFRTVRDDNGDVWFVVVAYSRPAGALMRLAGPGAVLVQHLYARLCGRVLRRLSTVRR